MPKSIITGITRMLALNQISDIFTKLCTNERMNRNCPTVLRNILKIIAMNYWLTTDTSQALLKRKEEENCSKINNTKKFFVHAMIML